MNAVAPLVANLEYQVKAVYDELITLSDASPNGELVARMLASRLLGVGEMPERLGLTSRQFGAMLAHYFPGIQAEPYLAGPPAELERAPEREELRTLLLAHVNDPTPEHVWLADMLAAGCMGGNHLWQDLGLWSRQDVSALIRNNFPALAARNDRDMKWKKFLYKQLCNQEGIYTCRSPSCEVCDDYQACFAPEV